MNHLSGNSANKFLYTLPDNPAEMTQSDAEELQALISNYPQSSILRLLLAAKGEQHNVQQVAAFVKPELLFKITKGSEKLALVTQEQIFLSKTPTHQIIIDPETRDDFTTEANFFHIPAEQSEENTATEISEEAGEFETASVEDEPAMLEQVNEADMLAEEHDQELQIANDDTTTDSIAVSEYTEEAPAAHFKEEIDDEVFEEIVGIEDINMQQPAAADEVVSKTKDQEVTSAPVDAGTEDKYFVLEPSLSNNTLANESNEEPSGQISLIASEAQPVTKYNDEKMPYSFMWWLDKTRKEHASTNQPYVAQDTPSVAAGVNQSTVPQPADHLQQQYYENIFAVSAVVGDLSLTPAKELVHPPAETKEDKIIERFIQEEPQIKHPNDAKLNNENKAKKSSEDQDELVTETLAKIYTDQMLYHKAIFTYKKLMLKFPEKSTYFAGQIGQLESKIN